VVDLCELTGMTKPVAGGVSSEELLARKLFRLEPKLLD
jgi:hypothetical protein